MPLIQENLKEIEARLGQACLRCAREPHGIQMVAVSKFQTKERILEAAKAGLRHFAESRQQEARTKLPELKALGEWHFIGHLQSNKARSIAELFDVVESVDSQDLARKLSQAAQDLKKELRIYAQFNISGEPQKHGFDPAKADEELEALARLKGLKIEGLMGMAAPGDAGLARSAFKKLAGIRQAHPGLKLSMGMSDDFEIAVEEGADLLRLGTILFR